MPRIGKIERAVGMSWLSKRTWHQYHHQIKLRCLETHLHHALDKARSARNGCIRIPHVEEVAGAVLVLLITKLVITQQVLDGRMKMDCNVPLRRRLSCSRSAQPGRAQNPRRHATLFIIIVSTNTPAATRANNIPPVSGIRASWSCRSLRRYRLVYNPRSSKCWLVVPGDPNSVVGPQRRRGEHCIDR